MNLGQKKTKCYSLSLSFFFLKFPNAKCLNVFIVFLTHYFFLCQFKNCCPWQLEKSPKMGPVHRVMQENWIHIHMLAGPWEKLFFSWFIMIYVLHTHPFKRLKTGPVNLVVGGYAKYLQKGKWQLWRTQRFSSVFCRSSLYMYMYVCGISHEVANKWQHWKLMNVDCPHIFEKQYFCSIKSNNFFEFRGLTLNPNGFRIV